MHDLRTRTSATAHREAGDTPQKIQAIFASFLQRLHPSQGTGVLPPRRSPKPRSCSLPLPEPGRRYLRLVDPPQISTARWTALSRSQTRAIRLIRVGCLELALEALREGTWRNPEEELRKLLSHYPRAHRRPCLSINAQKEAA